MTDLPVLVLPSTLQARPLVQLCHFRTEASCARALQGSRPSLGDGLFFLPSLETGHDPQPSAEGFESGLDDRGQLSPLAAAYARRADLELF